MFVVYCNNFLASTLIAIFCLKQRIMYLFQRVLLFVKRKIPIGLNIFRRHQSLLHVVKLLILIHWNWFWSWPSMNNDIIYRCNFNGNVTYVVRERGNDIIFLFTVSMAFWMFYSQTCLYCFHHKYGNYFTLFGKKLQQCFYTKFTPFM